MAEPLYQALLIGNSTFPGDRQNLQDLGGPVNDIAALREALTDADTGLFEPGNVTLLPERSMGEILIALERFFSSARRENRLFLYYSGHGLLNQRNQLFLCARDTRTDLLQATAVSAAAVNSLIDDSSAETTVIVLDCCHAGAFKGGDLSSSLRGEGRFILASCRGGQLANDSDAVNGTSMFTTHFVAGMRSEAADVNGDGYVSLSEIYDYVHDRLVSEGRQIPQRSFAGGGDVAIARRRPAPVDAGGGPAPGPPPGPPPDTPGGGADLPPMLDISQTALDWGELAPGEEVPPERVYVLNRGGGTLEWSVDCDADWIAVRREALYFDVQPTPRPGLNRARVLVRDLASDTTRTLRATATVSTPSEAAPAGASEAAAPRGASEVAASARASAPAVPVGVPEPAAAPPEVPGHELEGHPAAPGGSGWRTSWRRGVLAGAPPRPRPPGTVGAPAGPWWRRPRVVAPLAAALALALVLAVVVAVTHGSGSGAGSGGGSSDTSTSSTTTVTVPGNQAWTDTGVDLSAGQSLTVDASGEVRHNAVQEPDRRVGPDGDSDPSLQPASVIPTFGHAGLIGRIGSDGQPFAVGAHIQIVVPVSGRLELGINDKGLDNNDGEFSAEVRVGP